MEKRLLGFDLLRGICALSIAIHHTLVWRGIGSLHNIGTYGVYVFFILSGASMVIAYGDKQIPTSHFIARRYFRLAPLYWLVLFSRAPFGQHIKNTLINALFLFGFANPGITSHVAGGWSLGIEFIFYFTFPLFLCVSVSKYRFIWLSLAVLMQILFVSEVIQINQDFSTLNGQYTQFISFIGYFLSGCITGQLLKKNNNPHPVYNIFFWPLLGVLGFACINTDYVILGEWAGALLTLLASVMVYTAGRMEIKGIFAKGAALLGTMSYGVYLLHPRMFNWFNSFPDALIITATVILALVVEKYFERPIKNAGYMWMKKSQIQ